MSDALAQYETEADFARWFRETAQTFRWLVHHERPAMNRRGKWSTPIEGDAGFPDWVLARRGVVLFAELKKEKGRLSPDQQRWCTALGNVHVWRPRDKSQIIAILK